MKNMRDEMGIVAAYQLVDTYRGAAAIGGTTHKTVKRVIERAEAGGERSRREPRTANYEPVRELVVSRDGLVGGCPGRRPLRRVNL